MRKPDSFIFRQLPWSPGQTGAITKMFKNLFYYIFILLFLNICVSPALAENANNSAALDEKVRMFLASRRGKWVDWNVPEVDGKILYDIIIKNHY